MNKILRIFLIVLFGISALFTLIYYAGGKDTIELAAGGKIETYPKFTDTFLIWAYILTALTVGLTVVFPVIQMITNPKNAKKGLLGVVALLVVLVIAYVMSPSTQLGITNPELVKYDVPSTIKYAGTMINSIYILAAIAIASMIYTEVSKIFK